MAKPMKRWLSGFGSHATLEPDSFVEGAWVLSIGDAEQSHVNLEHPGEIFYEYLRRLANHIDVFAEPGTPLRVLHLGAGALTLARYIQATRPGSHQVAVDSERELLGFVLDALPLAPGTDCQVLIGDARGVLGGKLATEVFDVIVLDIFSGWDAPDHLTGPDFYAEMAALLDPAGIVLINVGDDPPLTFADAQISAVSEVFAQVSSAAAPELFSRRYPGNMILMGTNASWPADALARLASLGPHPGTVLVGADLDRFGKP
ncbi:spermidine synthase [Paeniglutamicibacter cryotolerans]|uniref:Spermidine synthase n=1 Tax=Paeniglutamicibacter cryotolerans TaxID=670079 RepID=A0A839QNU1_9MICC|nr:fused MFS/spermidine synthase [Paeniglutamicibacter cryotolerans]MBB2997430.1 spermidine synthase [Paeniglutamicibacter cryotolerans]